MLKSTPILALFLAFAPITALSHEFWIDAPRYQVETGEKIEASLRNGQNFNGLDLSYFERRIVFFDRIDRNGRAPVEARAGDAPAFAGEVDLEGLFTLVYQSTNDTLIYREWAKFQKFIDHKAFGDVRSQHDARGLPEAEFKEVYSRYAKALFAVGTGAGQDAPRGLEIEIVALKNPYTDDLSSGLPVQVIYRDLPRANAQVEVFEKAPGGEVLVTTVQTNSEGIAIVPVKAGHEYLLDNVVLREPSAALADKTGAVWETLWAALTFRLPG
ncbi:MAG: DUF4198 domain-containing protein [Pseudomonadota bacterium]